MSSRLFFEPVPPLEVLERDATEQDLLAVAAVTAPARRAESLAWRAIVRREAGEMVRIAYDEWGAPIVEGERGGKWHIGVSHSAGRVAVIMSREGACVVDVERCDRNFERVLPRYLSAAEQALSLHPHYKAVAWCAKECMYKYHRRRALDLLRDVRIVEAEVEQGRVCGEILDGDKLNMKVEFLDGYAIVTLD
ncbi:MAG: 4'-phosphopantetheinyl transferase superfamily protein [Alistipes sp.]|nr:4'-phosphopantetheinyl transferase superfamily protein [Alistipes sp.]